MKTYMKKNLILLTLLLVPVFSFAQSCPTIRSDLWYGNRGNSSREVAQLQNFLFNYYGVNMNATGFFGKLTKTYVAKFQAEQGIRSTGGLGPLTKIAIARVCGSNGNNSNNQIFCPAVYQPVCGRPVCKYGLCGYRPKTFSNSCELKNANAEYLYEGECDDSNNPIYQGPKLNRMSCSSSVKSGLTNGSLACYGVWDYGDEFGNDQDMCGEYGDQPNTGCVINTNICNSGKAVAESYLTNSDLNSTINSQKLISIASNLGVSTEVVKKQMAGLWEYKCTSQTSSSAPANCKVWYDGCNTCSRSSIGGALACTLMACMNNNIWNSGAYCKEYFNQSGEVPVIKSFSGPVQLHVGEKGTWSVQAEIFNNQQLSYNITWGDEKTDYKMALPIYSYISAVTPQNTTFEHTYSNTGTYIVTITVTGNNGQSTKTTSTVNVTGSYNSCYYNGTTYYEGQTKSTWQNGYLLTGVVDVCRGGIWKQESAGLPPNNIVCTTDAYQCPNGTWVGRTGPNCQFTCPTY